MPLHDDEMNKRREKREALRKKREKEQRRLKVMLVLAVLVLAACGIGIYTLARNAGTDLTLSTRETAAQTRATTAPTQETTRRSSTTTIHIKAAGDLNVTDSVVNSGLAASGYDFTRAFQDVASTLCDADLTVMNFEGNVYGQEFGSATTSAPAELLAGLRSCGVDLLQTANSCSINNGLIGLSSTLSAIRSAGLEPLGAYASSAEFKQSKGYVICTVQGIKVAFVAFTKGVGGMGMPSGNEDCVNLLYTDYDSTYKSIDREGINAILDAVAAEKPDITIAMLHWGSEYNESVSDTQKNIVTLMKKKGVDVIIGTHPHLVQQVDFDQASGTLVAYSLGDFFGDATRGGTNYSIILDIEITKDAEAGTTRVTDFSYTPIYTLQTTDSQGDYSYSRVVRIYEAMLAYENNYVDKITSTAYANMEYALTRIESRVSGKG